MRRNFQTDEIEFIRKNYKHIPIEQIGTRLSRSSQSIANKIFKLGLKLSEEKK